MIDCGNTAIPRITKTARQYVFGMYSMFISSTALIQLLLNFWVVNGNVTYRHGQLSSQPIAPFVDYTRIIGQILRQSNIHEVIHVNDGGKYMIGRKSIIVQSDSNAFLQNTPKSISPPKNEFSSVIALQYKIMFYIGLCFRDLAVDW